VTPRCAASRGRSPAGTPGLISGSGKPPRQAKSRASTGAPDTRRCAQATSARGDPCPWLSLPARRRRKRVAQRAAGVALERADHRLAAYLYRVSGQSHAAAQEIDVTDAQRGCLTGCETTRAPGAAAGVKQTAVLGPLQLSWRPEVPAGAGRAARRLVLVVDCSHAGAARQMWPTCAVAAAPRTVSTRTPLDGRAVRERV
jgi:hypothetical protein